MYEYHATCKCGYKSQTLCGNTCVCNACRNLVDVANEPFSYSLSGCSICGGPISEDSAIMAILGKGWLRDHVESKLPCPKCGDGFVTFHLGSHFHVKHAVNLPKAGDRIEGCIKRNGKLDIPWFSIEYANLAHDIPNDLAVGTRVVMTVEQITTAPPTDSVGKMFYEQVIVSIALRFVGAIQVTIE